MIVTPSQLNKRAELYHQLGSLLSAGITILNALENLQRNPPDRSFRKPLAAIQKTISQGSTLSEAIEDLGQWMPAFDQSLIQAGEKSGRLDVCFKLLAVYYRERTQLVRGVISDLIYPLVVLHMAVIIFPFIEYFAHNNLTMFLLRTVGVFTVLYIGIFFLVWASQSNRGSQWRAFFEKVLHQVPVLGTARRFMALGRLSAALESLITAGVPIIRAWELASAASGSPAIAHVVAQWDEPLQEGQFPSALIAKSSEFPEMFANIYHTGEVSGQLDDALKRLHNYYQDEGTRKLRFVARWTPQLVYYAIAIYVGYKIISFFLGYFALLNQVMQ